MRIRLRDCILLIVALAALLPLALMDVILRPAEKQMAARIENELNLLARSSVEQTARDIYNLCVTVDKLIQDRLDQGMKTGWVILAASGGMKTDPAQLDSWDVVIQETGKRIHLAAPRVIIGDKPVTVIHDFATPAPLVDEIGRNTGLNCSLFVRVNEAGDMLRVLTNVAAADGGRDCGSLVPAVETGGAPNPVITAVLRGEEYRGTAKVANFTHLTIYKPVTNAAGRVTGMLGMSLKALDFARPAFLNNRSGKRNMDAWALGATGTRKGVYLISPQGLNDGANLLGKQTVDGRYIAREIINKALSRPAGEISVERYYWPKPGEKEPKLKVSAFTYFPQWDWAIGVGVFEEDFYDVKQRTGQALSDLRLHLLQGGIAALAVTLLIALLLANRLARPTRELTALADKIAGGNLRRDAASDTRSDGSLTAREFGLLRQAFTTMRDSLRALISQVRQSGIKVMTSSTEIAASARQMEATVTEQAASTNQVRATARQISERSGALLQTMGEVTAAAAENSELAENCQTSLRRMEAAMRQLIGATGAISARLSTISEKAANISGVVTTINKVAAQTNLLSLNAAVEAEKAGEYGQGFAVVAREIRRLADQTSAATGNIATLVGDMHSAVNSGVMEMDRFVQQVRHGGREVETISGDLAVITDKVRAFFPRFETVTDAMRDQTDGAGQISDAMVQLSQTADQTRDSLVEFNRATSQLTEAVQELQREVARFRVEG